MHENEISKHIVDAAFKIHSQFGPGLLESAYEAMLAYELRQRGFKVERQVAVPLIYEGVEMEVAFRVDLLVDEKVLVELKSIEKVLPIHKKQTITYLKLTKKRLGLLINFGEPLIRDGIHRLVHGL